MRISHSTGLVLLIASGVASAQATLSTVEVRAESDHSVMVSCASPEPPTLDDVDKLLGGVSDPAKGTALRKKLMSIAAEACRAGNARIQVARGEGGGLNWKPLQ